MTTEKQLIKSVEQIVGEKQHTLDLATAKPINRELAWREGAARPNSGNKGAWLQVGIWIGLCVAVTTLWVTSIGKIDPRNISDLGLVTALPPSFFAALGILSISFCIAVCRSKTPHFVLFLHLVIFIAIIHGTLAIVYETPRYAWTYKHVGVTDFIQRTGTVDPIIDVYHNWPGFFALSALFNQLTGTESALPYAAWAPLFFNMLFFGALLILYKALTTDRRLIWLGIWLFFLTNWVAQDYYSPQALSYFFYLIVIGICLTWLKSRDVPAKMVTSRRFFAKAIYAIRRPFCVFPEVSDESFSRSQQIQRAGVTTIAIIAFAVIASSHQLTPFMTIAIIWALVVFQQSAARGLPVLMSVIAAAFIIYMADRFLSGNIHMIVESIGRLSDNIDRNISTAPETSPDRALANLISRVFPLVVWGLALVGAGRRFWYGSRDLSVALLAIVPFLMIALQSYGGEMIYRVYFFALPGVAFFAASMLIPFPPVKISRKTLAVTILVSLGLLACFILTYYKSERMNNFTLKELEAAQYVYRAAPKGSLLLSGSWNSPMKFEAYDRVAHLSLSEMPAFEGREPVRSDIEGIAVLMSDKKYTASYFIITRSQKEHVNLLRMIPAGSLDKLEQMMAQSERFRVVFENADAKVFVVASASQGAKN